MVDHPLYGSSVTNGQLVSNFTMTAMFPKQAAAPYMYGNGSKPATLAGFSAGGANVMAANSGMIGGGPTVSSGPFDIQNSPVIWAILFLVVGFIGLRSIHWKAD